jgi:hypothetical protein
MELVDKVVTDLNNLAFHFDFVHPNMTGMEFARIVVAYMIEAQRGILEGLLEYLPESVVDSIKYEILEMDVVLEALEVPMGEVPHE